jgi:hypothetical protein
MKISDIIVEGRGTKLGVVPAHQEPVMGKTLNFRDLGGFDRTHHLYRIMMACAMSDGKNLHELMKMDPLTWHSKYNTAHPYTEEEYNMVMHSIQAMGADWTQPVKSPRQEEPMINRASVHRQVGPIALKTKSKKIS